MLQCNNLLTNTVSKELGEKGFIVKIKNASTCVPCKPHQHVNQVNSILVLSATATRILQVTQQKIKK